MRALQAILILPLFVAAAAAQAPVIGPGSAEDAVVRAQRQAGAAHRELEQAQYEAKLAEQDVLNLQDAVKTAPPAAVEERKRQLAQALKAHAAARAKAAQARTRYDAALDAVDAALGRPGVKQR